MCKMSISLLYYNIFNEFNFAETDCKIDCNLGILLMNSNCFQLLIIYVCSDIYIIIIQNKINVILKFSNYC